MTNLRHDYPEIPPYPPRRPQGLTPDARLRIGLDREPIDWGDLLVFVVVGCAILYPLAKWWLG